MQLEAVEILFALVCQKLRRSVQDTFSYRRKLSRHFWDKW